MGFFNTIFGEKTNELPDFWKNIESEEDLKNVIEESHHQKVVIFKHSTRCFISKTVLKNFEKEINESEKVALYYFLDLLAHRNLSNKIAEDFEIEHQSPQIIVLENGVAINNASHQNISLNLV